MFGWLFELNLFRPIKPINILSFFIIIFFGIFLGAKLLTCLVYLSLTIWFVSEKWRIFRRRSRVIIFISVFFIFFGLRLHNQQVDSFTKGFFDWIHRSFLFTFASAIAFCTDLLEWVRFCNLFGFRIYF